MKFSFVIPLLLILSPLALYSLDHFKEETQQFIRQPLESVQLLEGDRSKENTFAITHQDKSRPLNQSIVDPESEISDFDARFEFAKILSHHEKNRGEAQEQYALLLKQNPHYSPVWLETSRLYIGQGKFNKAFDILYALVYQHPLNLSFLIKSSTTVKTTQTASINTPPSIVNTEDGISDNQARLELARIFSRHENSLNEAIQLYQILLKEKPDDSKLILEISRIYIRQKKYYLALSSLYFAIDAHPYDSDLLVEAAHAELELGHAKQSHTLLSKALALSKHPKSILMDDANVLMLVGSFYKVEAIYEQALKAHPNSLDVSLKLAWTYVSAQRYEEAEGLYKKLLLDHPYHPKILEGLVSVKMMEKEFCVALETIGVLRMRFPKDASYLQLKAEALYKNENYVEALEEFDYLSRYPKFYTQALIGKGRTQAKLGQCAEAQASFQMAYAHDPLSIQGQFYQAGEAVAQIEFIQNIMDQTEDPQDLIQWASVYADNGMGGMTKFYETALMRDPDYFPAYIGLAEALSFHYKYEEALEIYLSLLDSFPEASKIMIAIARVLSWGKNYENSMQWYDQIIALNPQDPVPRREKARVAYWGKFFNASMETYQTLLQPTVDELLLNALQELMPEACKEYSIFSSLELLSQSVERGSLYKGYEAFSSHFAELSECLNAKEKSQIEAILIEYLSTYRIQKAILLERDAKSLDWQNYYLHALPVYQDLIDFSPGNQEGLYGFAQDLCNLGLCKRSRHLYDHILNSDPNNRLVKMALERNLLREHSLIQNNYMYWTERGSGQYSNSQIARQQLDEVFEWSPSCNEHVTFMQSEWLEYPFFTQRYYPAEGQTLAIDHTFNGSIKGLASVSRKNYFHKFPSRYTCLATLWFNLYDYANIGIGFERRNEIYNYFNLKQGTQAKVYWISLKANSHSWNALTTYRHMEYNDHNALDHINLLISYAFTEDPDMFKIILDTSYRNTAHLSQIITSPTGKIVNVIHPYWTPRNYYSGSITLEFRHNYAWFNYCEAPQRYVDIKLTGENDTTHNPSIQLAINWKHEFMHHWGFEMTGLYHRSKLWNANGIWTQVYYRF